MLVSSAVIFNDHQNCAKKQRTQRVSTGEKGEKGVKGERDMD